MDVRLPLAGGEFSAWAQTQLDHGVDLGVVLAVALVTTGDLLVDGHADPPDLVALLMQEKGVNLLNLDSHQGGR